MNNLQKKSKTLFELRQTIAEAESAYKVMTDPLKIQRDQLQLEVMQEFKQLGTFSMRYDFATVSLAVRKTPKVVDEGKVIAVLKKMKLAKEYTATRLTDLFYDNMKELVKDKSVDGIEISETEYLSISTAKEGKDKRKINTQ